MQASGKLANLLERQGIGAALSIVKPGCHSSWECHNAIMTSCIAPGGIIMHALGEHPAAVQHSRVERRTHCPSLSMQFSKISPAPRASTALASSTASMSRPSRPPFTVHSHLHHKHTFLMSSFLLLLVQSITSWVHILPARVQHQ